MPRVLRTSGTDQVLVHARVILPIRVLPRGKSDCRWPEETVVGGEKRMAVSRFNRTRREIREESNVGEVYLAWPTFDLSLGF
jgi:hypothetical protein